MNSVPPSRARQVGGGGGDALAPEPFLVIELSQADALAFAGLAWPRRAEAHAKQLILDAIARDRMRARRRERNNNKKKHAQGHGTDA